MTSKRSALDVKLETAIADTLRRLVSGQPERGVARALVVAVKRVLLEAEIQLSED